MEDIGVDGTIILKYIFKIIRGGGIGLHWLKIGKRWFLVKAATRVRVKKCRKFLN